MYRSYPRYQVLRALRSHYDRPIVAAGLPLIFALGWIAMSIRLAYASAIADSLASPPPGANASVASIPASVGGAGAQDRSSAIRPRDKTGDDRISEVGAHESSQRSLVGAIFTAGKRLHKRGLASLLGDRFSMLSDAGGGVPAVVFPSAAEVEIAARCMRVRDCYGNLLPGKVQAAHRVLALGMRQFPEDGRLQLFVSHFLYKVAGYPDKAATQLKRARALPMSLGLRFQVFVKDREMTQVSPS